MSDIIVTGQRRQDGTITFWNATTGTVGISFKTTRQVDPNGGDGSGDPELTVSVKVQKTKDETDQAKLQTAAQQLIKAIIEIVEALQLADPNAVITTLGRTTTAGAMLDTLMNTQFTVTDATGFNNNGVGTAQHGLNGAPNTDVINYEAIIGGATNGYADPGFPDNSGMHALVLHEVAHMTTTGYEFWQRSLQIFNADRTVAGGNFYNTDYATNVEAFANSLMNQAASASGVNLHGVSPGTSAAPVSPESIYQSHTGQPFGG